MLDTTTEVLSKWSVHMGYCHGKEGDNTEQTSQRRELLVKGYRVRKHNLFQTGIDMVQFSQLCQSCFRKSQSPPPR